MSALRTFARAERGGVSVLTALSCVALMGFAGLATDVGSVYLESRRLQGTTDLAAMAAIQSPAQAERLALATVRANGWPESARIRVEPGVYTADRAIEPEARFQPRAAGANAVRVEVTSSAQLYFGRLFIPSGQMTIVRTATASQAQMASFQIGSRLLSLNGGVANAVLSGVTGSSVNLSVMDYNSLLRADVDLLTYTEALRTRLDLEAASYEDTLRHEVDTPVVLEALADTLAAQDRRAEQAARSLAASANRAGRSVRMSELIDLGAYGAQDHNAGTGNTRISVSAMDLASAVLRLAGGDRQVQLNLGAGVPGLASTRAWLAIGERPNNSPWLTVTDDDDVIIRTAQTRLYIEANVGAGALANVRIPLLVELASAQARLEAISCGFDPRDRQVTLEVAPSVGSLSLGEVDTARLDNFRSNLRPSPAQLVRTGLIRVDGEAHVDVGGEQWQEVRFRGDEIDRGAVKTVRTRDAAQATLSTLLGRTNISVRAAGLGLSTGAVTSLVRSALGTAAAPLDQLLNGLLDLLGVGLGEADVRVNGVRCGGAALVA